MRTGRLVIRDRTQVLFYSRALISAFEQALEYNPARHHNQSQPELWRGDEDYLLGLLRQIVGELKEINASLRQENLPQKRTAHTTVELTKHTNIFLSKYASTLGTGSALVTIGLLVSLLGLLGIKLETIHDLLGHLR